MLREGDHILTPAGRWEILWEDEHGSIHNSMRPPALPKPLLLSDALEPLDTENAAEVDLEEASPNQQSPIASSIGEAANTSPSSPAPTNDVAADGPFSPSTADKHEVKDTPASTAVSSIALDASTETEPLQTPQETRKRPTESPSDHGSNKKVRFSPQTPEPDYSDDSEEPGLRRTLVEVIVPSTPKVSSARKSNKKARDKSTASPAANTRSQDSDFTDSAPVVYMAGTTTIDHGHKKIMRSFRELGGSITENIVDADVLCVGKDKPLTNSGSLLLAITSGKIIVTRTGS